MKEQYLLNSHRSKKTGKARQISSTYRDSIEIKEKDKKSVSKVKGPRQIFLDKYKVTGSIEEAKKELSDRGFNVKAYENVDHDVFRQWIDEEK